jgi:hypothetical protein
MRQAETRETKQSSYDPRKTGCTRKKAEELNQLSTFYQTIRANLVQHKISQNARQVSAQSELR